MITTLTIAIVLTLVCFSLVVWTALLALGLRWAKVEGATVERTVMAAIIVFVFQWSLLLLGYLAWRALPIQVVAVLAIAEVIAVIVVSILTVSYVFHCRFLVALLAWLPTLAFPVVSQLLAWFLLKPFLIEAFTTPTNAMAPTLLGKHWCGTCQKCGQPNYCSPQNIPLGARQTRPEPMICRNFHVEQGSPTDRTVGTGDRFLVAKFIKPKRWELMVFRYPEDPSIIYVKRLVGLPGEDIRIEDGAVWADGKRLVPPPEIEGIRYLAHVSEFDGPTWGSPERPAKLGPDEYFALGDFSERAKDSRYWQQGAPGHNPYAVPESYLIGVVTHIYWPPSRVRSFR